MNVQSLITLKALLNIWRVSDVHSGSELMGQFDTWYSTDFIDAFDIFQSKLKDRT